MEGSIEVEMIKSKIDYENYLADGELKAIYYSSVDCGVCKTVKPKVVDVFKANELSIRELSINELREVAAQQLILKSPTVVIYDKGREILRNSGFIDINRLNRQIEMMLS